MAAQTLQPMEKAKAPPVFGTGDVPPELLDIEKYKHRDRTVVSMIDVPLWDKAGWKGVGFVEHPDARVPPLLALLFKDKEAGIRIFQSWRQELGPKDLENKLRIAIITGIDQKHPAYYRLVIRSNIEWGVQLEGSHIAIVSRFHTMTPSTSVNLTRFLNRYQSDRAYFLAPGYVESDDLLPDFYSEWAIICAQLHVRPAWEITENDPDIIGIKEDDDIIIPVGTDQAPVLRTLERMRKRRGRTELRPRVASKARVARNEMCPCQSGKKFKRCHGK